MLAAGWSCGCASTVAATGTPATGTYNLYPQLVGGPSCFSWWADFASYLRGFVLQPQLPVRKLGRRRITVGSTLHDDRATARIHIYDIHIFTHSQAAAKFSGGIRVTSVEPMYRSHYYDWASATSLLPYLYKSYRVGGYSGEYFLLLDCTLCTVFDVFYYG